MGVKPFDELTIQDNFIFQKVMRNKRICKQTIERLLDIDVKYITYPEEEKSINVRLDSKSVRLDVYVNDDKGTVFNIEMQTTKDMEELAKRTRYYQALIDIDLLEKGQSYARLNNTYIIFICTFDIFDGIRHKYTFKNMCLEDCGIYLNDGATKLFLSTKGTADDVSWPLRSFLDYIDGKQPADALMQEIDTAVESVKKCDEWRREYMTLQMELDKAFSDGFSNGFADGEAKGRIKEKLEAIKTLMNTMSLSIEQAMKALNIPSADFPKYLAMLKH